MIYHWIDDVLPLMMLPATPKAFYSMIKQTMFSLADY